jgi:co-chaperonin GroES (HSP10)
MSSSKIYKGTLTPIHNRVIVTDMEFGEQKTAGGIIIASDDGQARGIHPRWGKVFAIGHENDDEYEIGDWILVEHGRWSRGVTMEDENGIKTVVRVVEAESILGTSKEKPADVLSRRVDNDASYLTE